MKESRAKTYGSPTIYTYELSEKVVICASIVEGPQSNSESYEDLQDFVW